MSIERPSRPLLLALSGLWFALSGCGTDADQGQPPRVPEPISISHYGDDAELFVEFTPLLAGTPASFIAHVTHLDDFRPVADGVFEVSLSGGGTPDERFRVRAPRRAGTFAVTVLPRAVGERRLSVSIEAVGLSSHHDLGVVTVHPDVASAASTSMASAGIAEISFPKEQQWRVGVRSEAAHLGPMRESVRAPATLRPAGDGEFLITAVAPGRLVAAPGGFPILGRAVARGDVLAVLIPRMGGDFDLGTLATALTQAQAAASLARDERERMERLFAQEAVAQRRLDEARAAERVARTQLEVAQRRHSSYHGEDASAGIALRAPMAGVLAEVHVGQGAPVAEGDRLFHLVDPSRLWLVADLSEADAGRLRTPDGVEFELPDAGGTIRVTAGVNGRLVGVGSVLDPASRTVPVIFALDERVPGLVLNQRVDARVFTGSAREALNVPAAAVLDDGGERVVYVQRGGERFARVPVSLGLRDGDRFEVVAGLAPGDRVVSHGAARIRLAAATPDAMGHGHAH